MKYAIIKAGSRQYKVTEGETILVDKLNYQKDSQFVFPEVLLLRTDETVQIGNPYILAAEVKGKVVETVLGDKIIVSKFKAKVRFRRKKGFRPQFTKVLVESITVGKAKTEKLKTKTVVKKTKTKKAA